MSAVGSNESLAARSRTKAPCIEQYVVDNGRNANVSGANKRSDEYERHAKKVADERRTTKEGTTVAEVELAAAALVAAWKQSVGGR